MIDKLVYRELCKESQKVRDSIRIERGLGPVRKLKLPVRHILIITLMSLIFGAWALDSLHYTFVPRDMHDAVADYTDPLTDKWHDARMVPGASQAVARNPFDGSPINAGSVVLLAMICTIGLTCGKSSERFKEAA